MLACIFRCPQAFLYSVVLHVAVIAGIVGYFGTDLFGKSAHSASVIYEVEIISEIPESKLSTTSDSDITPQKQELPERERPEVVQKLQEKPKKITHPKKMVETAEQASQSSDSSAGSGSSAGPIGDVNLGLIRNPAILQYSPKPFYPTAARRLNFEGSVELELAISEQGGVKEAVVSRGSGREDCDKSAQETILRSWRFAPAKEDGVAVPSKEKVVVSYKLR